MNGVFFAFSPAACCACLQDHSVKYILLFLGTEFQENTVTNASNLISYEIFGCVVHSTGVLTIL
jgi:hypothetical protein